ncbi:MAG: DUF2254 domain-containing protein [Chloroflexota bacterium]
MQIRPRLWWEEMTNSLWFVPSVLTLAAVVLAAATIAIDGWLAAQAGPDPSWTFSGGVEGARGVLSAIAGSLITVTGVVFSVTVVALQLASSQFTPRVLRNFMGDTSNQVVLGVFIGTFTYALLVLRSVRSAADNGATFVPALSVTVAIGLALVSVGFLIYFIDHTARSIQATDIIEQTTRQALAAVDRLFPNPAGESAEAFLATTLLTGQQSEVTTDDSGYVQSIDLAALCKQSQKARVFVEVLPSVGDYVLPGATIAVAWPSGNVQEEVRKAIGGAVVIGRERSTSGDLEFTIARVADIAVKALSPGINDPTTALICADRLAQVLVVLGNRAIPPVASQGDGEQALALMHHTTYARCVDAAFADIRHFGAGIPSFAVHLLRLLEQAHGLVPAERGLLLAQQARLVLQAAQRQMQNPVDVATVGEAGQWTSRVREPSQASDERGGAA